MRVGRCLHAKDTAADTSDIGCPTENVYLVKMRSSSNITCGSTKLVLPLTERYVFSFSFNNFWIFSQKMMNLLNSETVFRFMNIFMLFFKSWAMFSIFIANFNFDTLICFFLKFLHIFCPWTFLQYISSKLKTMKTDKIGQWLADLCPAWLFHRLFSALFLHILKLLKFSQKIETNPWTYVIIFFSKNLKLFSINKHFLVQKI